MTPGTQLGPYRVESLIGSGGMEEVYLGVDTRLDRQVAIKVLQGALARDSALRERFEREARTISSLSHPNICTLFDLGRHDGSDYLVMEYLHGETLADRIARGPLPPREVVRIGLGIASALEAAHRQGIVHRDLKPGNVMLTKSGVNLLDFGLAKLSAVPNPTETTLMAGATEQKPLTEQGAILGTFQNMAPEQLEGHPADARTDIFALGTILYEMATGRRAFQGTTKASLIAAIIDRDPPPMAELQPLTPPALERIVRACLTKDPDERIQTAHDVALQLRWIDEASSSAIEPVGVRRRKNLAPWITAAVFALIAIALGALWWRERTKPAAPFTLSMVAPDGYEIEGGSLAPDGKRIALVLIDRATADTSLWVRELSDGTMRRLVEKQVRVPFWSPDNRFVLATRFASRTFGDIWVIPVDGAKPWPYLETEQREVEPRISPDGRWVAYLVQNTDGDDLYIRPFPKGRAVRVSTDGAGTATWTRDGRELLWVAKNGVFAATVSSNGPVPDIGAPRELFRLPQIASAPVLMNDGNIALLVPAPDQQTSRPVHVTNAWRAKRDRAQN